MEDLGPYVIPNTHSHDFVAKSNGQSYRAWVATPAKKTPGVLRPVLYSLDANFSFASVSEAARMLAFGGEIPPVIVVGVGYGAGMPNAMFLRNYELTPSTDHAYIERAAKQNQPMGRTVTAARRASSSSSLRSLPRLSKTSTAATRTTARSLVSRLEGCSPRTR